MPMLQKFVDEMHGGFYFTDKDATDLVVRQKVATDSPLPSGNAVAVMALLSLGQVDPARGTLALFAGDGEQQGGDERDGAGGDATSSRHEPFRVTTAARRTDG